MTDKPADQAPLGSDADIDDDLYDERSALTDTMESEERQNEREGTFLSGGAEIDDFEISEERELDEQVILNPAPVRDGQAILDFLRKKLHRFESPYAYIGGEANSPDRSRFKDAEVRVLIARLSTYEATALSMAHSLLAQIAQELPGVFVDIAFLPKPSDYAMLKENQFPVMFGTNTKLGPDKFDIVAFTFPIGMETVNFIPLLHDSGVPIFKDQRIDNPDLPLIICGGMNSATVAPLCGDWTDSSGERHHSIIDANFVGDGEFILKQIIGEVRKGKRNGLTKREVLRNMHGKIHGFYEPDCYEHIYDGKGRLTEIKHAEGREYAQLPVRAAIVAKLDEVRTLETKILPYSGDGASVDVAIAGSRGCIGGPGGSCSFCREGGEAPYRERGLQKVLEALDAACRNQGTKEASFFSLNFNQYSDLFPLVYESVKMGIKVGLISQRIDMLAETPEQVRVQRWLKKSNYTLGIEGCSERLRSFLTKNTTEEQILRTCQLMMEEGAGELKLFYILTGQEDDADIDEWIEFANKVEVLKKEGGYKTRFRVSFTPLFPVANTPLMFYPAFAALNHGSRSLDRLFAHAKSLGWGRRLSVSGEEPLISNTINHGGRNILHLLLRSHFQDNWRFYGSVAKGTWARWKPRIDADPNIDTDILWGEKDENYVFPWEDIRQGMPKETLYESYKKCTAFQGSEGYCLTTRLKKGKCRWKECGLCSLGTDDMKPNKEVVSAIINRKVAEVIPVEKIAAAAKSREKAYHVRVLFETSDPIYRFVNKSYFANAIPRALMKTSDRFNSAFVGAIGHARIAAGANLARDWTFGRNIYDFSLADHIPESELRAMIDPANELIHEGKILDLRMDTHLTVLRNDVDYALYTMLIPNSVVSYDRIRSDVERFFERKSIGRDSSIKMKKAQGKGVFVTVHKTLDGKDVRQATYEWAPEHRGTIMRFVVSGNYNPLAMLEAITGRKSHTWKEIPIFCDGYVQLPEETNETDIFAALAGEAQVCSVTGGPLEMDLFSGKKLASGICLAAEGGLEINFPARTDVFYTHELQSVELSDLVAA